MTLKISTVEYFDFNNTTIQTRGLGFIITLQHYLSEHRTKIDWHDLTKLGLRRDLTRLKSCPLVHGSWLASARKQALGQCCVLIKIALMEYVSLVKGPVFDQFLWQKEYLQTDLYSVKCINTHFIHPQHILEEAKIHDAINNSLYL